MTRSLRHLHRWIWVVLALVLPTLIALGVVTRSPLPQHNRTWEGSKP